MNIDTLKARHAEGLVLHLLAQQARRGTWYVSFEVHAARNINGELMGMWYWDHLTTHDTAPFEARGSDLAWFASEREAVEMLHSHGLTDALADWHRRLIEVRA